MAATKETIPIYYINIEHLIRNKEGANRPKDLEDLYEVYKKAKKKA